MESYDILSFHPQTQQEFDVTENKIVQYKIKEFIYECASSKCNIGLRHVNFNIQISRKNVDT